MSEGPSLVLGIDVGTSSVKVVIVDPTQRNVIAHTVASTEAEVQSDIGAVGSEQDPRKIMRTVDQCMNSLPDSLLKNVKTIGVSGQMHGVLLWNKQESESLDMMKISNLVTWQDGRCDPEFIDNLPEAKSSTNKISTGFGCGTLFWYHHHRPGFLDKYTYAGTIQDFVACWFLQKCEPVMSPHNAVSWGYFDTVMSCWENEVLQSADFPVHLLPKVVEAGTIVGHTKQDMYGIPTGASVANALGDLQCSALASIQGSNLAALNLSTSAQVAFQMPPGFTPQVYCKSGTSGVTSLPPPGIQFFPYIHGRWLAVAASLNGGNVVSAFVDMLHSWLVELGLPINEGTIWEKLESLSHDTSIQSGSDSGPKLHATVFGERHCPDQKASLTNISSTNMSLQSVFLAICKGLVSNLKDMMPVSFLQSAGVTKMVASGSVVEKNAVIQEELVRQFSPLTVEFHKSGELNSAFGAALTLIKQSE